MEPNFLGFLIRIPLHVESRGTERIKFFSQGTNDSQDLRYGRLIIADYDCVKSPGLIVFRSKLWLKEGGKLHRDHP